MSDEEVTIEYCLEHHWLVGSPATVAAKIEAMYDALDGFGTLMCLNQDFIDEPEAWRRSLELLGTEVLPRIQHLVPDKAHGAGRLMKGVLPCAAGVGLQPLFWLPAIAIIGRSSRPTSTAPPVRQTDGVQASASV